MSRGGGSSKEVVEGGGIQFSTGKSFMNSSSGFGVRSTSDPPTKSRNSTISPSRRTRPGPSVKADDEEEEKESCKFGADEGGLGGAGGVVAPSALPHLSPSSLTCNDLVVVCCMGAAGVLAVARIVVEAKVEGSQCRRKGGQGVDVVNI